MSDVWFGLGPGLFCVMSVVMCPRLGQAPDSCPYELQGALMGTTDNLFHQSFIDCIANVAQDG